MTELIKFEGIIIKKRDINDSDRLLTVFTTLFGKIQVIFKGINKSKKRDKTSCDVLSYSRFVVYKKNESYIASTIDIIQEYSFIKKNMQKIGVSLYICSLLNEILNFQERKNRIFDITEKSFAYIDKEENEKKIYVLLGFYLYNIIEEEGIKFYIEKGNMFSIKESYLGSKKYKDSQEIGIKEIEIIEEIKNKNSKAIFKKDILLKEIFFIIEIFEKYINYHLELKIELKKYIWEESI